MGVVEVTPTRLQFLLAYARAVCIVGWVRLDLSIHLFAYKMGLQAEPNPEIAITSMCLGLCEKKTETDKNWKGHTGARSGIISDGLFGDLLHLNHLTQNSNHVKIAVSVE